MEVWVGCELLVVFYGESPMNEWRPPFTPELSYIYQAVKTSNPIKRDRTIFLFMRSTKSLQNLKMISDTVKGESSTTTPRASINSTSGKLREETRKDKK